MMKANHLLFEKVLHELQKYRPGLGPLASNLNLSVAVAMWIERPTNPQ
jgi:hypothetical protein